MPLVPVMLMNLGFAAGETTGPTGQNPPASRYRFAFQFTDVIQVILLWLSATIR